VCEIDFDFKDFTMTVEEYQSEESIALYTEVQRQCSENGYKIEWNNGVAKVVKEEHVYTDEERTKAKIEDLKYDLAETEDPEKQKKIIALIKELEGEI
jgi:uncharacterized protein YajQ (UPF0234 family)